MDFFYTMTHALLKQPTCICLGPIGSGKSLLLKRLQGKHVVDETSSTVPSVGTNIISIPLEGQKEIVIREIGGFMAPIWNKFYDGITKVIFVVDASNLCQIAAAGVLFYTILTEPLLQNVKILIALSKMDASYRQMRNEALLMLQYNRLKKEVPQQIVIAEVSAMTGEGVNTVLEWIKRPNNKTNKNT